MWRLIREIMTKKYHLADDFEDVIVSDFDDLNMKYHQNDKIFAVASEWGGESSLHSLELVST